jgi:hypothetical protein
MRRIITRTVTTITTVTTTITWNEEVSLPANAAEQPAAVATTAPAEAAPPEGDADDE